MINRIRLTLIEAAKDKLNLTYSDLNRKLQLGLDYSNPENIKIIENLVREISIYEFYKNRPLIGSLVTLHCGGRQENDCFNKVCEELFESNWEILKKIKNWEELIKTDCYEFWQNSNNYNNFKNDIMMLK